MIDTAELNIAQYTKNLSSWMIGIYIIFKFIIKNIWYNPEKNDIRNIATNLGSSNALVSGIAFFYDNFLLLF
jgi:hypothetical protein